MYITLSGAWRIASRLSAFHADCSGTLRLDFVIGFSIWFLIDSLAPQAAYIPLIVLLMHKISQQLNIKLQQ